MHKSRPRNTSTPKAKYPNVPGALRRALFAKVHDPRESSRLPPPSQEPAKVEDKGVT